MAVPEAELLRVIERALQAQRMPELGQPAPQDATAPLVSRIETILGKRLEAANDAATAPNPPADDAAAISSAAMDEAAMDDLIDDLAAQEFHVESTSHPAVEHPAQASPRSGRSLIAAGALCALGAFGGTLIPSEPSGFRAQSLLGVEGPAKDHRALVSAAHDALISQKTIAMAVAKLQLDRDAEFAGASGSAFNVVVDLLSASGAAADPVSRAEASLAAVIRASADPKSGTVGFSVTTASAAKSARIASYLVSTVAHPVSAASVNDGAVKKASAVADAELEAFTKQNGEGNVEVATRLQQQLALANETLKDAQQKVAAAKTRADLLKTATADDALTGTLAADITSPALDDRRGRYAVAKSTLAQLAASLGPRHPRLIAQQAEVDGLRTSIGQELGRLSRDAADEVKSTVAAVRQLGDQRNTLIAQSRDTGVDLAKLTELREKSAVARQRLEDQLSTGAIGTDGAHVQVIKAPVVTAIEPGRSPWLAPALGALAGLAFGLAGFRRRVDAGTAVEHVEPVAAIEPSVDIPRAPAPEPSVEDTPDEVETLRAEIAAMRDRLRSYAATA